MRYREDTGERAFAVIGALKHFAVALMALGFIFALVLIIACAFTSAFKPLKPFDIRQDKALTKSCDLDLELNSFSPNDRIVKTMPKLQKGQALEKSDLEGLINQYVQTGHKVQYLYSDGMLTERWSKRFYAQNLEVLSKQKALLAKSTSKLENVRKCADVWIIRSAIEKFERSKFAVIPPVSTRSLGTVIPLDNPGLYIYVKELVFLPVIDRKHSRYEFICFEVERYIPVPDGDGDFYQGLDGLNHCVPD